MKVPYLLAKAQKAKGAEKKDQSNSLKPSVPDFSKPDNPKNKDSGYQPNVMRGLSEPVTEGDLVEAHHPKHGMKTRGRVTAVGTDGYRMRIADGSALDIPHSHTIAKLPVGDYGTEQSMSPQDAKDQFLGPTKEGQLPATPLQIAVLDVLGQYGFPVDEQTISTINYDQAKRVLTKYLMDDRSTNEMPDSEGDSEEDGSSSSQEGSSDDSQGEDTEGQDEGMGDSNGGDTDGDEDDKSPEFPEVPGGQGEPGMTPGTQEGEEDGPEASQPSTAQGEDEWEDDDTAKDGSSVLGPVGDNEDQEVMQDPEVLAAVKQLIGALSTNSQAPGTPDEETTGSKEAQKHPEVKKKVAALVNASNRRIPPRKKQGA